ncbi:MAG: alpha/beta hydrolase [Bacteroidia bacterium]|nr:alpha/beta hydrolase [Bacteroidia bacterium]
MKTSKFILSILPVMMLVFCVQNVHAQTAEYRDITFAQAPTADGGSKTLRINIWKGEGDGPRPVVLFVHGGAWESGDNNLNPAGSEQIRALLELREKGVTVAAATYRFSRESVFPAQIFDVKAAIRYLKANADVYGIDPARIMTMGESAGAHLALLAAVSNGEEALEGDIGGNLNVDSSVIGCVDCYGMTDFLTLASDLYARPDLGRTDAQVYDLVEAPDSSRSRLFGLTTEECNLGTVTANPDTFPEQYALVKAGSPLYHVTPDDPPILIINGQKDIRVASAQAIKMYQALYDAGVEAELLLNDRAPHGNLGPESAAAIQSFILRVLFPN